MHCLRIQHCRWVVVSCMVRMHGIWLITSRVEESRACRDTFWDHEAGGECWFGHPVLVWNASDKLTRCRVMALAEAWWMCRILSTRPKFTIDWSVYRGEKMILMWVSSNCDFSWFDQRRGKNEWRVYVWGRPWLLITWCNDIQRIAARHNFGQAKHGCSSIISNGSEKNRTNDVVVRPEYWPWLIVGHTRLLVRLDCWSGQIVG